MSVYVDPIMNHGGSDSFPWAKSCHMYADSLDELHAIAATIGMRRSWFQDKRVPHYDLTTSRRAAARRAGAIAHTREQAVAFWNAKGWHNIREPGQQGTLFK